MTIQYASDLHLEMKENCTFLFRNPLVPSSKILILAGDILYLKNSHYTLSFLDDWSSQFEQVYIVPGNHEYYCGTFYMEQSFPSLEISLRPNVHVINNKEIRKDNIRILFTTLYTRLDLIHEKTISRSLGDFRYAKYDSLMDTRLSTSEYNKCHFKSLSWLESTLEEPFDGKTIVVTHHVPYPSELLKGYPYPHDGLLNSAFHVDLRLLIEKYSIEYWISGHTHFNHDPLRINETTFLTNQLGYVSFGENFGFSGEKTLEI